MTFAYSYCTMNNLPAINIGQKLDKFLQDEAYEEARQFFLCVIRTICLDYLEAPTPGTPSELIEKILSELDKDLFVGNESKLSESIKYLMDCLPFLISMERSYRFFEREPTPEKKLCLRVIDISSRLSFLKKNVGESVVSELIEETDDIIEVSIPTAIRKFPPPQNESDFFQLILLVFKYYSDLLKEHNKRKNSFWNGRLPQNENFCSDNICRELECILGLHEVKATREHYFGPFPCDFCFQYGPFKIPAEAKCQSHNKLWKALDDQLIQQYIANNDNNYGLYLVYWFGERTDNKGVYSKPRGSYFDMPTSHSELEKLLTDYCLPHQYKNSIAVVCLDFWLE